MATADVTDLARRHDEAFNSHDAHLREGVLSRSPLQATAPRRLHRARAPKGRAPPPEAQSRERGRLVTGRSYRQCAEPGCETHFIPKSVRNRFCLRHLKTGPIDPEHYRKYGTAHRRLRAQMASRVARGIVRYARGGACKRAEWVDGELVGGLILPDEPWDLDHVDGGGVREYRGPSHAGCNRATSTHIGRIW